MRAPCAHRAHRTRKKISYFVPKISYLSQIIGFYSIISTRNFNKKISYFTFSYFSRILSDTRIFTTTYDKYKIYFGGAISRISRQNLVSCLFHWFFRVFDNIQESRISRQNLVACALVILGSILSRMNVILCIPICSSLRSRRQASIQMQASNVQVCTHVAFRENASQLASPL